MAEFCPACWSRMNGAQYGRKEIVLTHSADLCEGCGEIRRLVARMRCPRSPLRYLPLRRNF